MSDISEVRAQVFEMSGRYCEWPSGLEGAWPADVCGVLAIELAHIVSRGMGGSAHRDTVKNTFAACPLHARVSDWQAPVGGYQTLREEWSKVPGCGRLAVSNGRMVETEPATWLLMSAVRESRHRRGYDVGLTVPPRPTAKMDPNTRAGEET